MIGTNIQQYSTHIVIVALGWTMATVAMKRVQLTRQNQHILAMPVDIAKDPINVYRALAVLNVVRAAKSFVKKAHA